MFRGRKLSLRKEPDEFIIHAAKNDTSNNFNYLTEGSKIVRCAFTPSFVKQILKIMLERLMKLIIT